MRPPFDDAQGLGIRTAAQYARTKGSVVMVYDALDQAARRYRGQVRRGEVMAELEIESDLTDDTKKRRAVH